MGETIIAFRLSEAPAALTRSLPKKAGPWRCLFFIAPVKSRATEGLFAALPEPPIDHADEAMTIVGEIAKSLHAEGRIPKALGPGPVFNMGFHSGSADEALGWLKAAGHTCLSISELPTGPRPRAKPKTAAAKPKTATEKPKAPKAAPDDALRHAATRGDLDAVLTALRDGASVHAKDRTTGATALHEAAGIGRVDIVDVLLEHGADVNAAMKNALTPPLGSAIDGMRLLKGRHLDVVKRLLAAGARTDVLYGRTRTTALQNAAMALHPELVACLLEAGAAPNALSQGGMSALEHAVQAAHDPAAAEQAGRVIRLLRAAGAKTAAAKKLAKSLLGRDHVLPFLSER